MAKQHIGPERVGSAVAQVLEQYLPERSGALEIARAKFLAGAVSDRESSRRRRVPPWRGWRYALVPAALAAVAIMLSVWSRHSAPLSFRVDGKGGELDAWLAAPAQHSVFVDFSDGTGLRIERSSRARVVGVSSRGAKVSLESGELHAEVNHARESAWMFVAGPLVVRVIGTKFDLKWDPGLERFEVAVTEGSVAVSGTVAGSERAVRAGETLSISLREHRLELINGIGSRRADLASLDSTESTVVPGQQGTSPSPSGPSASTAVDSIPRKAPHWRELAARGQLREAYAAAESFGFTEACQTANAAELLLLGDAARLAGRPERASTALLTLRQRYPKDSRSAAAAFVLGKIAFDQRHAYDVAATWFSTCLKEQPTGGFAREAAGRLIEAYRSAGNPSSAEAAARAYVTRYPNGPHADLARSLLP